MKLSEKGAKKVFEHAMWGDGYYDLEDAISVNLDPDDFQGAVVLTVEEANLLFNVIDGFFDLKLPTTKEIVALNKLKVRVERIAKAEKCDE